MGTVTKYQKPRLIRGVILKCTDGHWVDGDGLTPPNTMLVIGTCKGLQCWGQANDLLDVIVEQPNEPLPDVDALNAQIPEKEWGVDLVGKPRPPWQLNYVVYLVDMATASTYTFLNSTTGARIAWERLTERINNMRFMRGNAVAPIVELASRPMKTSFGVKQRPEFIVKDWRDLGPSASQIEHKPNGGGGAPAIEHKPDDFGAPKAAAEPVQPKKATVGKPVKPVSVGEEIDDGLPFDLAPPTNILKAG